MSDLPSVQGLRIISDSGIGHHGPPPDYRQRYAARMVLHYASAMPHPRLPDYAARLGHVSLALPANPAGQTVLVELMQALASERRIGQAYVAAWDHDDEPKNTLYERATLLISSRAIFKCAA